MIFTGADAIFSGLVSGIVATAVMTVTEIPSWRKWGMLGVFEWYENQLLSIRFFHLPRNKFSFKYIFFLHFLNGSLAGIAFPLILSILENLLLLTNRNIVSQKASQILTTKIINLLLLLIQGTIFMRASKRVLAVSMNMIKTAEKSKEYKSFFQSKDYAINIKPYLSFIDNFSKNFYSNQ